MGETTMNNNDSGLKISKKSFVSSVLILLVLMLGAGVLTWIIPGGSFERALVDGKEIIQPGTFHFTEDGGYPLWRWFTAPVEVLWGADAVTVIAIIVFICIIGGVLTCAMIFMPYGNTAGFLALFFISYLGRIIVDNAVPTMLFPLIDPKIAGSYNAWRCVLYNLCSIIVTPIISVLVEKVNPLWLLIPGTVTYVIVTVWYYIVCKKLTKA